MHLLSTDNTKITQEWPTSLFYLEIYILVGLLKIRKHSTIDLLIKNLIQNVDSVFINSRCTRTKIIINQIIYSNHILERRTSVKKRREITIYRLVLKINSITVVNLRTNTYAYTMNIRLIEEGGNGSREP